MRIKERWMGKFFAKFTKAWGIHAGKDEQSSMLATKAFRKPFRENDQQVLQNPH